MLSHIVARTVGEMRRQGIGRAILRALAVPYGAGLRLQRCVYEMGLLQKRRLPIPVICVGNFAAGGTGKTPFAVLLADKLIRAGRCPMILARGYGDDEQHMLAHNCAETNKLAGRVVMGVGFGADRVDAFYDTQNNYDAQFDCVILDDGLQHWRLHRDMNIVMVNAYDPWGGDALLPAGTLRERPEDALPRSDIAVLHNCSYKSSKTTIEGTAGRMRDLNPVMNMITSCPTAVSLFEGCPSTCASERRELPLSHIKRRRVAVIAGIGSPEAFIDLLRCSLGASVLDEDVFTFPDHHPFTVQDVDRIQRSLTATAEQEARSCQPPVIVITEKDYFRCLTGPAATELLLRLKPLVLRVRTHIIAGEDVLERLVLQRIPLRSSET